MKAILFILYRMKKSLCDHNPIYTNYKYYNYIIHVLLLSSTCIYRIMNVKKIVEIQDKFSTESKKSKSLFRKFFCIVYLLFQFL